MRSVCDDKESPIDVERPPPCLNDVPTHIDRLPRFETPPPMVPRHPNPAPRRQETSSSRDRRASAFTSR